MLGNKEDAGDDEEEQPKKHGNTVKLGTNKD